MLHSFLVKWICYSILFWIITCPVNRLHAQVSLPTGAATADIPLYNYSDKNRLNLSVGIYYTGGNGIKVNELASCVGLGWELMSGGSITRVTAGKPDDQYGNISGNRTGTGRLYANYGTPTDCYNELGRADPEYFGMDREADVFNFNLNGRTGSFVISRKAQGETAYKIRTLSDSKLKIQFIEEDLPNVITRISKFIITTEDGTQYTFSEKELTEIVTTDRNASIEPTIIPGTPVLYNPADAPPAPEQITIRPYRTGKYVINNWYLSEIRNVLNWETITFEYSGYDLDFSMMKLPVKTETLKSDMTVDKVNYTILDQRFVGKVKHISRINLPQHKQVEFLYMGSRLDIPGDSVLATVNIKSNGSIMDSYAFNYQYHRLNGLFDYNSTFTEEQKTWLRLSLRSIDKNIGTRTSFIGFEYCGIVVPPRGSLYQDYAGYFTGSTATINNVKKFFDLSMRQPDIAAQNGMLKRINYAAGGYLEYEYELRTCMLGDNVKTPGGVRVKKTTVYDGIDHANDQVNTYKYVNDDGPSGMGYEEPVYSGDASTFYVASGTHLASRIIASAINRAIYGTAYSYISAMSGNMATQGLVKLIDDVVSVIVGQKIETGTINTRSTAGYALSAHNPLPVIYERVEVIQGDDSKNMGKIVYDFTSFLDRPVLIAALLPPYTTAQRVEDWSMGLPKQIRYYDAGGKLVKQVNHQYQFTSQTLNTDTTWVSCKCEQKNKVLPVSVEPANRSKITYQSSIYYPTTGRAQLIKTTTQQFYLDNNVTTEETTYEYDPLYYTLKKVTTTNSTKESIQKRIYYPGDYNQVPYVDRMKTFNLLNIPVATETWLMKPGSTDKLLNAGISEFGETPDGDLQPVAAYQLMSNKPVEQSAIGAFDPGKLNRAPAYFKKTTDLVYNIEGDLVQQDINGNTTSYVYAYDVVNDRAEGRLLAVATNAGMYDIAFTGFETTGATGGWEYQGKQLVPVHVLTGTHCYDLASGNIKKNGLTPGKKYKISYWAYGPGGITTVNLSVGNTVKKGITVSGYTYYEHEFTAGSATLEISGSAYLDNVRLHPVDAQMKTFDYDVFGNVTAVIDESNMIIRYEYDSRQRLVKVSDCDWNILKVNEYKD